MLLVAVDGDIDPWTDGTLVTMLSLRHSCSRLAPALLLCIALVSCGADAQGDTAASQPSTSPDQSADENRVEPPAQSGASQPQPFVPDGPVGSRNAYDALIGQLDAGLPAELRAQVPWPDLRNPDPVAAQLDIFDMWIWMAANHPEPELAAVLTADDSPSRIEVGAIFGGLKTANHLHIREQQPYRAFDHRVVTLASADLPLWVTRDVPTDAVVVYYKDDAGPLTIRDRDTQEILGTDAAISVRQWLSVMVPTDVGWLLYRDILIDPTNSELEVPERFTPPSANADRGRVQP